jgi:hypothetical protein
MSRHYARRLGNRQRHVDRFKNINPTNRRTCARCLSMAPVRLFGEQPGRKLPRCLVWVIAKLTHAWDIEIELTGSVIGGGSEVDEVSKPARHSFG